jgi:hypothetical protein
LREAGLTPLAPTPKEALALINGATLTSALAALAIVRARRVFDAMEVACAMTMEATRADRRALSVQAIDARNHPGGSLVATRLGALLEGSALCVEGRPPDAFSVRAAPAVLGAARDALVWAESVVTRELNGAGDNPLWFAGEGVVEVGNFHGAPVALALDALRIAVVQAATRLRGAPRGRRFATRADAVTHAVGVAVTDGVIVPLANALPVAVAASDGVSVALPLPHALALGQVDAEGEAAGEALAEGEPERDAGAALPLSGGEAEGVPVAASVAPVLVKYVPAPQSVHAALPALVLYFPATQAAHEPPSGPVNPALHVQAARAVLGLGELELPGHVRQVVATVAPAVVE